MKSLYQVVFGVYFEHIRFRLYRLLHGHPWRAFQQLSIGRLGDMKGPLNAGEGNVFLQRNTDGEGYIRKFDDPAKKALISFTKNRASFVPNLGNI